jgi:hypothetical protein
MTVSVDASAATTPARGPGSLDPADVGRAHRAVEPLHSFVYFADDHAAVLVDAGLRPGRMPYFASRAAPMGAVGPGTVTATFYNFNPTLVARFVPRAWTLVSPDDVVAARLRGVDVSMRRVFGEVVLASDEVAELAGLLREATTACAPEGRPLFAAHASLAWPEEPHLALWHGATLLREHRGDGHLAALLSAGLSGIEAIVTHVATGRGFRPEAAKLLRGWSDDEWSAAQDRLRDRGWLDDAGALTPDGADMRAALERHTDSLAAAPWEHLGAEGTARVVALAKPLARSLAAAGAFPSDVFPAPRS